MVSETSSDLPLNELLVAARDLQTFLESRHWEFCFIGGLAVQAWGEPRFTRDVDLTLVTGFGGEEAFVDALLSRYRPRRPDARDFALHHRVLLLASDTGIGIDIALGALEFEREAARRAIPVNVHPEVSLRLCSPEDLIVMKAFANRPQDWMDVRMILVRQSVEALDWRYVLSHLKALTDLKAEPEILSRLEDLCAQYALKPPAPQ